ncbi:MAG: SH3 domain-containing protein [Hyphomicrobiales bacterium]|nr:SH3 domain-containing protein [Hyphomicrobiales bacterium]
MTSARVNSAGLSLRDGASRNADLVTELARGDIVDLIGAIENGWAYVRVVKPANGSTVQIGMRGYVDARFIDIDVKPPDVEPCPEERMPETEPLMPSWIVAGIGLVIIIAVAWRLWWVPLAAP